MSHKQVFLSHSTNDLKIATDVDHALAEAGVSVWMAPRNIAPGVPWADAIVNGIEQCEVFLLVLSTQSNSSVQVLNEVSLSVDCKKRIIVLRIENVQPTGGLKLYLGAIQWLDEFTPDLRSHFPRLIEAIQNPYEAIQLGASNEASEPTLTAEDQLKAAITKASNAIRDRLESVFTPVNLLTPAEVGAVIDVAVHYGAPVYNAGSISGCADIYRQTATGLLGAIENLSQSGEFSWNSQQTRFVDEATAILQQSSTDDKIAWALREAFDCYHSARGIADVDWLLAEFDENENALSADFVWLVLTAAISHGHSLYDSHMKRVSINGLDPMENTVQMQSCAELHHHTAVSLCSLIEQHLPAATNGKSNDVLRLVHQELTQLLQGLPAISFETGTAAAWQLFQKFTALLELRKSNA